MEPPELDEVDRHPGESVDVFYVLDRLEELVGEATKVPLSGRVMVDSDEFLDLIEQLRITLPDEIRQAQRVIREREKIVSEAQTEAGRVMEAAKKRAEYFISEKGLLNEASQLSEDLLRRAEEQRKSDLGEIDIYAMQQFNNIEAALREGLQIIDAAVQQTVAGLQNAKNQVGK